MSIVDWIYPKVCVGCGREGEYICQSCQLKLYRPVAICPMCCEPSVDGWVHGRCKRRDGLDRLMVGLPYKGIVQNCLKKVKYKSAWEIVSYLFELWRENCSDTVSHFHTDWIVTSVPMWHAKERSRGFNQADMLADLLVMNLPGVSRKVCMLTRVRETRAQYGLDKEQRKANIEGAFGTLNQCLGDTVSRLILVDDVWTTGATMRECAKVLKLAGVKEVWGVALAR